MSLDSLQPLLRARSDDPIRVLCVPDNSSLFQTDDPIGAPIPAVSVAFAIHAQNKEALQDRAIGEQSLAAVSALTMEDNDSEDEVEDEEQFTESCKDFLAEESKRRLVEIQDAVRQQEEALKADRDQTSRFLAQLNAPNLKTVASPVSRLLPPPPMPVLEPEPEPEEEERMPLPPEPVPVPRLEGWVKKKGRQMMTLWKWRYMVLEHNCLLWWKRIEHYKAGDQPWGYLDFNHIPPHIAADTKEIRVEMPGRSYRLWTSDPAFFAELRDTLTKQEEYTRAWVLRAQGEAMERDLEANLRNFQIK